MGVNHSRVANHTGKPLCIVTYNCTDVVYALTRDRRQVPDNGTPISVDSLAGGAAVKVAVIYNKFVDDRKFVCDLFRVPHDSQLEIKAVTQGSGVTSYSGRGVELLEKEKGMTISLEWEAAQLALEIAKETLPLLKLAIPGPTGKGK